MARSGPCRRHKTVGAVPVSEGCKSEASKVGDKCGPISVPTNEGCKSKTSKVGDKCGRAGQVRLPRRPALHGTRYIG